MGIDYHKSIQIFSNKEQQKFVIKLLKYIFLFYFLYIENNQRKLKTKFI